MTVPVGIATFFFLPDTPYTTKAWFLTEEERVLALERVRKQGTAPPGELSFKHVASVLTRWRWYGFVIAYVVSHSFPSLWNYKSKGEKRKENANVVHIFQLYGCSSMSAGFFAIWLKSEGYTVVQSNVIPTGTWLISGFATVLWGYLSDYTGSRFLFVLIPLVSDSFPSPMFSFAVRRST